MGRVERVLREGMDGEGMREEGRKHVQVGCELKGRTGNTTFATQSAAKTNEGTTLLRMGTDMVCTSDRSHGTCVVLLTSTIHCTMQ